MDPDEDVAGTALSIIGELERFSSDLARRPRWLVFNKIDLLSEDDADRRVNAVVEALDWDGPVYRISALAGKGTQDLCAEIMAYLESRDRDEREAESSGEA
jgi:GTP-binding protein